MWLLDWIRFDFRFLLCRPIYRVCFLFLFFLSIVSCVQKKTESEAKGVREAHATYHGGVKRVCWVESENSEQIFAKVFNKTFSFTELMNPFAGSMGTVSRPSKKPASDTIKNAIRKGVTESYTMDSIGVTFEGWDVCPEMDLKKPLKKPAYDVLLFNSDAPQAEAGGLGNTFMWEFLGFRWHVFMKENSILGIGIGAEAICSDARTMNSVGLEKCAAAIGVHEFGHLFGLNHEHQHPDAQKDPLCSSPAIRQMVGTPKKWSTFESSYRGAKLTPYDPASIMNYCHLHPYLFGYEGSKTTGGASPGDIAAIKENLAEITEDGW